MEKKSSEGKESEALRFEVGIRKVAKEGIELHFQSSTDML